MNKKTRCPRTNNLIEIRQRRTGRKLAMYNLALRRFEFVRGNRGIHFVYAELKHPIDKDTRIVYTESESDE